MNLNREEKLKMLLRIQEAVLSIKEELFYYENISIDDLLKEIEKRIFI